MNEQEHRQDDIQDDDQNVIADLEPPDAEKEIKGGARNVTSHNTYTGTIILSSSDH